mmetsp:Transcript_5101/g.19101  ORF Transcript_5101/g.19101 Transcript_5101/m.19101 type:complete len:349 (-) Transcript_5101:1826-2872(-)
MAASWRRSWCWCRRRIIGVPGRSVQWRRVLHPSSAPLVREVVGHVPLVQGHGQLRQDRHRTSLGLEHIGGMESVRHRVVLVAMCRQRQHRACDLLDAARNIIVLGRPGFRARHSRELDQARQEVRTMVGVPVAGHRDRDVKAVVAVHMLPRAVEGQRLGPLPRRLEWHLVAGRRPTGRPRSPPLRHAAWRHRGERGGEHLRLVARPLPARRLRRARIPGRVSTCLAGHDRAAGPALASLRRRAPVHGNAHRQRRGLPGSPRPRLRPLGRSLPDGRGGPRRRRARAACVHASVAVCIAADATRVLGSLARVVQAPGDGRLLVLCRGPRVARWGFSGRCPARVRAGRGCR